MNNFTQSISTKSRNSFKSILTLCSFLLVSSLSFAQVSDDFTDGNFTASPAWSGNTAAFTVETATPYVASGATTDGFYLASDTTTGNVTLSTPSTEVNEWKFSLGTGDFSPASGNYFGVILMSSVSVTGSITATSWNGYYLKIGINGTTDPIELWVKNGAGTGSKVGDFPSSPNFNGNALIAGLNIRVTRSASGVFELFYSTGFTYGSTPTTSAGTLTNNTVTTSSFFGVYSVFAGPSAARRLFFDNIVLGTPPAAITSAQSGNWSSTSTWVGGVVPTSASNVIIATGHVVTLDTTTGGINTRNSGTTTTVNAGGTLATNVTYTNSGTTTVNGTFRINQGGFGDGAGTWTYGTSSTLVFNHTSGTYGPIHAGHTYWPSTSGPVNVTVANSSATGINLGVSRTVTGVFQTAAGVTLSSSTLTLNGICQLNGGGFFNNSPTYGAASTLVYNTSYGVYNEWTGNGAAGTGIPANVRVQSGTLTMPNSNRGIPGNITIDATCSLALNGTSGNLYIGGNWNNAGAFSPNGRAVFFNGATNQTITNASGETFNYLINNKSAGNLILANNVTVNATAGSALQILNAGAIDLNGQTLTLANNGGNIQVTGGARSITSSVAGGIVSITGTKTVTSTSSGTLTLGTNVTTSLRNGINFGASLTTIEGKLQVNGGGYVISNAPIYAATSTLEYNAVTGYGVNNEWTGNAATAGVGTPQNVTITNSSVNLPNAARSLAGNLIIGTSSTLNMNGAVDADLNIGGNWNNAGTFNPNNRLVTFRGASAQSLTGATTFDYLKMDNSAGLTLNNSITNTLTLDLTSGVITLGTNNLTLGSAGTVINASATSYVRTNSTGQFKRTVGASATLFPTGNSAYNPITFNNSGTSDEYGVRVLDGALTTGVNNTKTVSRRWVTTETTAGGSNLAVVTQYNSGEENTNFIAGTNPKIGFYNGSTWVEVVATAAGSNPYTYTSNTNVTPSDLTSGTQYFAIGKDNAFLSAATQFVITSITPTSPGAGYPFSVTVQSQDAFNAPTSVTANTSFTLSTNGNAGVIGGTIAGTILAGTNSIVVSGVTLASAGTGVTVTATQTSGDPLTAGTSATFTVLEAATQIAFVGVPTTGTVGTNLASFTVEARRTDNSIDTFYNTNIVLTKASGSGNLVGTSVAVTPVNGVATFATAQFDAASTYTLYANSGSLSQITSGSIVVTLAPVSIFSNPITGTNPNSVNPYTTGQSFNTNITVGGIGRGTGLNESNANNRYNADGWTTAASIDVNDYFEFTLTPNLGYYIDFNELLYTSQASGNGPTSFAIRSSIDGFASNITTPSSVGGTVSLTATSFDNVTSSITYRIYGFSANLGSGTFSINDFDFRGNVLCIQPAAYNVTGGGAICIGSAGTLVGLSNSQVGINYQLKVNGSNIGSPVAGTGAAISFGNQNTLGTYTVEATNTNGTCNELVTMTGSVSISAGVTTTWIITSPATTPAWDNGTPTSTMTAVISANYSEATALNACTLTVNSGAVVSIPSGTNVTLNGALTVASGSSFTLNNNANLIQSLDVNNSGNIIVKRQTNPLIRLDYMLWSSPVAGQGLYSFSPFTFANRFYTYTYNATTLLTGGYSNSALGLNVTGTNAAGVNGTDTNNVSFGVGRGYLIRVPYNHPTAPAIWTGTFTGVPTNGDEPVTLNNTAVGQRFNLIGNPYPSTISMSQFVSDNSSAITGTLYFWRKTNSTLSSPGYCTWAGGTFVSNGEAQVVNPNGIIQVGQGFLVEASATGTSVTFKNGQRVANNANQVFRLNNSNFETTQATTTVEYNRLWLNMTSTANEFAQMSVGYNTGATQDVDVFDGKYFNDGPIALNSIIGTTDYAIQGRALPFATNDVVPLSYKVTNAGNYTIALDQADGLFAAGAQDVFLKDNLNNTYTNLNTSSYTFASEVGTFNNRFEIVYENQLGVVTPSFTADNVVVYKNNEDFVVNSGVATMSEITVYDIRGRVLQTKKGINATETRLNAGTTNQVLLLQIKTTEGLIVTKKVIN